jgi:hypothetical protein
MKTEWVRGKNRERLFMKRTDGDRVRVYGKDSKYEGYVKPADPRFSRRADGEIVCRGNHPDLIHEHAEKEKQGAFAPSRQTRTAPYRPEAAPRDEYHSMRPVENREEEYHSMRSYGSRENVSFSGGGGSGVNLWMAFAPILAPLMVVALVLVFIAQIGVNILSLIIKGKWDPRE